MRRADVHAVVIDGEGVLLDERADRLHLLNHTAILLWQLYDGTVTLAELATEIAEEMPADRDAVLSDVIAITTHLADEELLDGLPHTTGGDGS